MLEHFSMRRKNISMIRTPQTFSMIRKKSPRILPIAARRQIKYELNHGTKIFQRFIFSSNIYATRFRHDFFK